MSSVPNRWEVWMQSRWGSCAVTNRAVCMSIQAYRLLSAHGRSTWSYAYALLSHDFERRAFKLPRTGA